MAVWTALLAEDTPSDRWGDVVELFSIVIIIPLVVIAAWFALLGLASLAGALKTAYPVAILISGVVAIVAYVAGADWWGIPVVVGIGLMVLAAIADHLS